ncbi:hypothetical protein SAMN05216223_12675 [Actinacidiphila yanglinensis]|uniref:Uncharacterized protein n=2 Tax=Actinacidiphila yanglinensis TaxID=310779 RepID=A0A1H6E745_9ACTN|nr:hypothetical protein SAMN05216223_12675 [Actinacidiphila yanglinensis]
MRSRFAHMGLDTSELNKILHLCSWMDDQLPMLKRRQGLAAALDHGQPAGHMVHLPEPVILTSAQAQANGKALAKEFNENAGGDAKAAARYHQLALLLAAHKDDPDFCSAFYAGLSPAAATGLPSLLAATGTKTGAEDLKIYSHAFGTAVSALSPAKGFDSVKKSYLVEESKGGNEPGWDRAAMLQYGNFPDEFLEECTRANVLDRLAQGKGSTFSGDATAARTLGLPIDSVALNLQALAHSGQASFVALSQMGDPKAPDLEAHMKLLLDYARQDAATQTALGKVFDVASGVRGHDGPDGKWEADRTTHSAYENLFAYETIRLVGNGDVQNFDGWFKQDMGRLAASYAPEMVTGSYTQNGFGDPDSSMGPPQAAAFKDLPGLKPGFYLSASDTYRFLKTFAGDDSWSDPLDTAMGDLQRRTLTAAAVADRKALDAKSGYAQNFTDAAKAFGGFSRLEYDAMAKVRGDTDKSQETFMENEKRALFLGLELAGEPEVKLLEPVNRKLMWRSGMWWGKEFPLADFFKGPEETEELGENQRIIQESARYSIARPLIDAGWKTTPIPPELRDKDGKLLEFEQFAGDKAKLAKFSAWLGDQNLPTGTDTFHGEEEAASGDLTSTQSDLVASEVDGK